MYNYDNQTIKKHSEYMLHKLLHIEIISKLEIAKIRLLCLLFLVISSLSLKAQQEPMYSQYMFNMLHINPAYTGNRAVDNITNMYRRQWLNVQGSPTSASLTWDRRQADTNNGYGVQIYTDQIGIENTNGIQGFYSYRLPLNESFLTFGLSGGLLYYHAAFSQVKVIESDPLFQEDAKGVLPTAGFGALYGSDKWYVGFSIPALLKTKLNIEGINTTSTVAANNHYFLTSGYVFEINEAVAVKPSFLMKYSSGAPVQFDFNANMWLNEYFSFGLSYRTGDALISMFEVQVLPEFRVGYAYDYTLSKINNYTKWGTHELMLRYEFKSRFGNRAQTQHNFYY